MALGAHTDVNVSMLIQMDATTLRESVFATLDGEVVIYLIF